MSPIKHVPVETMVARSAEALVANGKLGIVCPRCGGRHWRVRDTDPLNGKIRRYRICRGCGHHKTTFER
jgi:rubredoxin